jgi:hypothetical protein
MKRIARIAPLLAAPAAALVLGACGSGSHAPKTSGVDTLGTLTLTSTSGTKTSGAAARERCAQLVAGTLGEVGARIYHEASTGADVQEAVHRVQDSAALARAIATNDASAVAAALRSLQAGQIVRIEIVKGADVLASAGSGTAIAPVRAPLAGTDASFVLSTQTAESYVQVTHQVTGAEVVLLGTPAHGGSQARRVAGTIGLPSLGIPASGEAGFEGKRYAVSSLAGAEFPSGALRIALLSPNAQAHCASAEGDATSGAASAAAEQTRVETLGRVGERIYGEELGSPYVRATLREIETSPAFVSAVAARNTAAIRAAIVGFFAAHIHVVRVHVEAVQPSGARRFLYDLGGPYVLAPVHGVVRSGGHVVGRFSFAIQDDAGYVKLAQRFTGAEVLMRVGTRQVMGTLDPGPAQVPDRGSVAYAGTRYAAYSFMGEAFPSGPLRISLLVPSRTEMSG